MERPRLRFAALAAWLVWSGSASAATAGDPSGAKPDAAQVEFFEAKVRPVLVEQCLGCHGPSKQKGGLRLDSREAAMKGGDSGPAVAPGDPASSPLVAAVGYEDEPRMPPKGKLKARDIQALTEWVKMGAPWPESAAPAVASASAPSALKDPKDHWAFRPVKAPAVPDVADRAWPKSPIDAFVLKRLEATGLKPVEPADRRTLIRRVTFDLKGLPPTAEEVEAFVADASPGAFARVVDRLLNSPRYGERWGRHWLDVARYGEDQAHTFEARLYPFGFKFRDWVVAAVNADLPYDRFVVEQLAADQVDGPDRDARLAALGFLALGPVYYGKAVADELDDRVDTVTRGFLGLTVACARCHDHKFDPIPTKDYYALAGVFASTEYKEYPTAPREQIERFERAMAAIKAKTAAVNEVVTRAKAGAGGALSKAQAEAALNPEGKAKLKALRDELAKLKKEAPPKYPVVHALTEGSSPRDLKIHIRGNPENLGEVAPRKFLTALSDAKAAPFRNGSGRLELARAIASSDNPLTARVIVNRVWEHHFGRGLVATPGNFGTLGEPPSHPELLDHLASRFVAGGWSLKALHREILLSATYQLSGRIDPKNEQADADNVLLWRMNRRRLEVEAWRDAMLAVSGELDGRLGGPSDDLAKPDNRRRTFYGSVSRHNLNPLLRLFDFPDPNLTCDRRVVTSVPLQQLFVLNSEFMARRAKALAACLTSAAGSDADRIRAAFPRLYGRPATADEVAWGLEFLGTFGGGTPTPAGSEGSGSEPSPWEQYAQVLLGSNEFAFVD